MDYEIKRVMEHYLVFLHGVFICSGDTRSEAEREADKYIAERKWCK